MRKIVLNRTQLPATEIPDTPLDAFTYGIRVEVTEAYDMPREVFVKQRLAPDGSEDIFVAIASAEQLGDLPANEPTDPKSGFFRVSSFELRSLNAAALDSVFADVLSEVQLLVKNLNALDSQRVTSTTYEITEQSVIST